jgi:hypothetical protein
MKLPAAIVAMVLAFSGGNASAQNFYDANWGDSFSNCAGARDPVKFKVGNDAGDVLASGIVSCRDEGGEFVYSVEYMSFSLSPRSKWKSADLDWIGAAAQKIGTNGRNAWLYDEARPIRVRLSSGAPPVAISNVDFHVPKRTLAQARGFGFYAVGGGIFWSLTFHGTATKEEMTFAPRSAKPLSVTPPERMAANPPLLTPLPEPERQPGKSVLGGRADWGKGFLTCQGAKEPRLLKAASLENDFLQASGVITCTDAGDAFVYSVDYMNFVLPPGSRWSSAHLEWFGAGAQRAGRNGGNDWIFDEAKPIEVQIDAVHRRVAISNISFRIPKSVLTQARGFGFYVVGGGLLWSIALL